jgi:uncharacterized protein (TIGR02996 family)
VTTTTTITELIRAVRKDRDDDTPRLVLADALADTDPSEGGDAAWAELIRVQCELAKWGGCDWKTKHVRAGYVDCDQWNDLVGPGRVMTWCPSCARRTQLRASERALRAEHEVRWRQGGACGRCGGSARVFTDDEVAMQQYEGATGNCRPYLLEINCPDCAGTGHAGPLGEKVLPDGHMMPRAWRVPADFRRGFIASISTPLADVFTPAGDTVTEWAKRVARWPHVCLEEWGLTDREPALLTLAQYPWLWQWHPDRDDTHRLPRKVILAMYKLGMHKDYTHTAAFRTTNLYFDTPDAARLALARAVAQVVREAERERG